MLSKILRILTTGDFSDVEKDINSEKNFIEAKETNELAEYIVDKANEEFEKAQNECIESLQKLDNKKKKVFKDSLLKFVNEFVKVKHIDFNYPKEIIELEKYKNNSEIYYPSLNINTGAWESSWKRSVVKGTIGSGLFGSMISNYMNKKSQIALDNANANYAEAELMVEEMEAATDICGYIKARADMFTAVLVKLDELFTPMVNEMIQIISKYGTNYKSYSINQQKTLAAATAMASSIKAVIDVPILTEDGDLTQESKDLAIQMGEQLKLPYDEEELGNTESIRMGEDIDYSDEIESYDSITNKVISIVADKLGLDEDEVKTDSFLYSDLGVDDFDMMEILMDLEKAFGINFPDYDDSDILSVEDLIDLVREHL